MQLTDNIAVKIETLIQTKVFNSMHCFLHHKQPL